MIAALNAEGWKLAINDNGYGVKGEKEVEHTRCLAHVRIIVRYTRRETQVFRQVSMNRSTTYPSEDKRRREGDSLGAGSTGGKKYERGSFAPASAVRAELTVISHFVVREADVRLWMRHENDFPHTRKGG